MNGPEKDSAPFQVAVVDTRRFVVDGETYERALADLDLTWTWLDANVASDGSLWVLSRNWYDKHQRQLLPFALGLTARIRGRSAFMLKNVLVVYREMLPWEDGKPFAYGHFMISFFVKSLRNYYFDKDSIREPHVFKDIEWGRRKRGKSGYAKNDEEKWRYSRKGKDPGNVFYKTIRNGEGYILAVNEMSDEEIYERFVKVSTRPENTIASNIVTATFRSIVLGLGRKLALFQTTPEGPPHELEE